MFLKEYNLKRYLKKYSAGVQIETSSSLPEGSGMGASSILAGCVVAALWALRGARFSRSQLVHAVLLAEQRMSCGGGWQDNVNGLCAGGFKVGQSGVGREVEPEQVTLAAIPVSEEFAKEFEERVRLLLPNKDPTRLAKDILRVRYE